MKCPKCNLEIEDGSRFCSHCGANIQAQIKKLKNQDFTSSNLLLIWAIVTSVCVVANSIITNIVDFWYENPWRMLNVLICIIQNLACLLVPFAVKKIPHKIVVFVLTGLFVAYWIIMNIKFMIN